MAFIRLATRSSISGTVEESWLSGFGCLFDGLRVFMLTGSTIGSTIGSNTGSAILVAFVLALDLALALGAINSEGVVSLLS